MGEDASELPGETQTVQVAHRFLGFAFLTCIALPARADYRKAVEGSDVVKNKLYPREGRFQVNLLEAGVIMNQSLLDTTLVTGALTYHFSEWNALSLEGFYGLNQDKPERAALESFFWDPKRADANAATGSYQGIDPGLPFSPVDTSDLQPGSNGLWPGDSGDPSVSAENTAHKPFDRKPAYMPTRRINQMFLANYQWTPVYGKALWFLSLVGYLDFYTSLGGGLAMTTYWPLKNTGPSGQSINLQGVSSYGDWGPRARPTSTDQVNPVVNVGIGSRFFFWRHALVNLELRNFTVFGSDASGASDIMNFFGIWGGLGILF